MQQALPRLPPQGRPARQLALLSVVLQLQRMSQQQQPLGRLQVRLVLQLRQVLGLQLGR